MNNEVNETNNVQTNVNVEAASTEQPVVNQNVNPTVEAATAQPTVEVENKDNNKKKKTTQIILAVVASILVIVCAYVIAKSNFINEFFNSNKKGNNSGVVEPQGEQQTEKQDEPPVVTPTEDEDEEEYDEEDEEDEDEDYECPEIIDLDTFNYGKYENDKTQIIEYLAVIPTEAHGGVINGEVDGFVWKDAYTEESITYLDVSDELLLENSIGYVEEVDEEKAEKDTKAYCKKNKNSSFCHARHYYLAEDLTKAVFEHYNRNVKPKDFLVGCGAAYYVEPYVGVYCGMGNIGSEKYGQIEYFEKSDSEVTILERVLYAKITSDGYFVTSKSNYSDKDIITKIEDVYGDDNCWYSLMNNDIRKYISENMSKGHLYKHTFKINENGFYWYKSEIVE